MSPAVLALAVAAAAALPSPRHGYSPERVERYTLSMTATVPGSAPDGASETFDVDASLTLRVASVDRAGAAAGTLTLDGFTVTDSGAVRIAHAPSLPDELLAVPVTVTRDGRIVASQSLLLVTDRARGPWVARVQTDAHGLLPAVTGRGLRASHALGFEPRSGRPILPIPPEVPPDASVGPSQTFVPLLPTDALALVVVPDPTWKIAAPQRASLGQQKITRTVTARSDRRTALTVTLASATASPPRTAPPAVRRDGSIDAPARTLSLSRRGAHRSLSGELTATFDGGRRVLSGLDTTLGRTDTLDGAAPRAWSLAVRLRHAR